MKRVIKLVSITIGLALLIMILPRFFNSDKKESSAYTQRQGEIISGTTHKESPNEKKFKQEIASGSYHFFIFRSLLSLPL
jgi:hypothetical protein